MALYLALLPSFQVYEIVSLYHVFGDRPLGGVFLWEKQTC